MNPSDNQGIRDKLCTWFLEVRDTEGCAHLLRKFAGCNNTHLAYADVLLQYFLWKRGDTGEKDVKKALYFALKENPVVPDLLQSDCAGVIEEDEADDDCSGYSPGSTKEAKLYVESSYELWRWCQECVDWIESQRHHEDRKVPPSEDDLIDLLAAGVELRIVCAHTDLKGNNRNEWILQGTQKRSKCVGCRMEDFKWPRQLNRKRVYHQTDSDILVHHNVYDELGWRKTKYSAIQEVPFWSIFLEFWEHDNSLSDGVSYLSSEHESAKPSRYGPTSDFPHCKECNNPARFCALDNGCTDFYCSKSCMEEFLEGEIEPPFFDLQEPTLKLKLSENCTVQNVSLDDALLVAINHMPNLNSVDLRVPQDYILKDDFTNDRGRNIELTPIVLRQFLEEVKEKLVAFVFRLPDCCWEEMKEMTGKCSSLTPLGSMPYIKKLDLTHFGFDDVMTLSKCLSTSLRSLTLSHVMMGRQMEWSASESNDIVTKLCQLTNLATLDIADSFAINDSHLHVLLPNLPRLRCLSIEGRFGDIYHSQLTDVGFQAIADYCPRILSLNASYLGNVTINGVRRVIRKCHDIIELELGEVDFELQHLKEIVTTPPKLRLFRCGNIGVSTSYGNSDSRDQRLMEQAVLATEGRVVICTLGDGKIDVSLSSPHKRNQDQSMDMLDRAYKQQLDPLICQQWDGII